MSPRIFFGDAEVEGYTYVAKPKNERGRHAGPTDKSWEGMERKEEEKAKTM